MKNYKKYIYISVCSAFVLIGLEGCNSGHKSASSSFQTIQEKTESTSVANLYKIPTQAVKSSLRASLFDILHSDDISLDDIKWPSNIWDQPFMFQSVGHLNPDAGESEIVAYFPHGRIMYQGSYTNSLSLSADSLSSNLTSNERIVSVKPCYEYSVDREEFYPDSTSLTSVALTSENRVFIKVSNKENVQKWELATNPYAHGKSNIHLNDIACYVEPSDVNVNNSLKHMFLSVVGYTKYSKNDDSIEAYAERGYSILGDNISNISWTKHQEEAEDDYTRRAVQIYPSVALTSITIGNSEEPGSGRINPVFVGVGRNGVAVIILASLKDNGIYYTGIPTLDEYLSGIKENKVWDANAIAYVPKTHSFLTGGTDYLSSFVVSDKVIKAHTSILIEDKYRNKPSYSNNEDIVNFSSENNPTGGNVGVTSIACVSDQCALAIKDIRLNEEDDLDIYLNAMILTMRSGSGALSGPSFEKFGNPITLNKNKEDDDFPVEFNAQVYGDLWNNTLYFLTSTHDKSMIYKYHADDSSMKGFQVLNSSMPSLKR